MYNHDIEGYHLDGHGGEMYRSPRWTYHICILRWKENYGIIPGIKLLLTTITAVGSFYFALKSKICQLRVLLKMGNK